MLELIIALLLSLGIVTSPDQVNEELVQEHKTEIKSNIIDDDLVVY